MKEDKKVPQLRFPEFTDAWKQRKLGEIIDYSNGIGHENYVLPQGKYELVTLKSINSSGKLVCSEKFVNEDFETLKAETLIMMLSEQAKGMLGMTTIIPCDNKYVLNQRVAALKAHNDVEVHFLTNAINNKQNYFEQMGAGTKVQNITRGHVEECVIELPSLEEQKKIGSLFSKLEVTITLQQRKLNSLQKLKKGLLQKMFPKNGENIPEIRFPEFSDAWKQRKLGDILKLLKDGTHGSHKDVTNGHYLLSAKNIKDGRIFWDKTDRIISDEDYKKIHSTFKINKGDVLLTIVGSIGETAIFNVSEEITFQRSVAILRPIDEVSSDFLYSEITSPKFQKFLNLNKSTSAQPGIYLGDLANISFSFPENKEEQKMIGRLFTDLNSTITLQQRKLESLQKLKKGLLQQMFI